MLVHYSDVTKRARAVTTGEKKTISDNAQIKTKAFISDQVLVMLLQMLESMSQNALQLDNSTRRARDLRRLDVNVKPVQFE